MPELLSYAGVCALAGDLAGFIAGIESALAECDDPASVQQRLEVAQANTWAQRVQTITDALKAALRE